MKGKLMTTGVLLAALLLVFSKDIGQLFATANRTNENRTEIGEAGSKNSKERAGAPAVTIVQQWNLPDELAEVSGIAWVGANRFACVQDEEGYIFLYNTATATIENKIRFAGPGDYEGITLAGNTAYVVRSDGMLYEVANYRAAQPKVATYKTPFSAKNNVEGLTFDPKNNRLLLALKDKDLSGSGDGKGVYPFSLATKTLDTQPAITIASDHASNSGGKKDKAVRPSAIGIHPKSGLYYVVDGPQARLLVLDGSGKLVTTHELGSKFAQPEGITFDPTGRVFISNERGKKSSVNIMEIRTGMN